MRRRRARRAVSRDRGDVEAAAELGEELQDLGRRIGLDGVEDVACRAAPWRSSDSFRGRHRDRPRGRVRSSLRCLRNSRMRAVISTSTPHPTGGVAATGEPPVTRTGPRMRSRLTSPSIAALVRMREIPFRTAGKEGQALSVSPAFAPAVIQKSPSVVALSRVASGERDRRFASGCRSREQGSAVLFLRRLSGLLSGCPPIDTRPQARAKLGNSANKPLCRDAQAFWRAAKLGRSGFDATAAPRRCLRNSSATR